MQILKSAKSQSFTARRRDAKIVVKNIELHFTTTRIENASFLFYSSYRQS